MSVVPGKATRLAYRGDHLRLIDLAKTVGNGDTVPVTLKFRDASGRESTASTDIVVRGLLRPQ
jgi:copper(I)-binding protein